MYGNMPGIKSFITPIKIMKIVALNIMITNANHKLLIYQNY